MQYKMLKIVLGLLFLLQTYSFQFCNYRNAIHPFSFNNSNIQVGCESNIPIFQTKIVNTPIFFNIPKIKLHHMVLVTKNKDINKMKDVYIFDFSQRAKLNPFTILKLIVGCSVPSEIRIIHFPEINEKTLIDDWYKKTKLPNDFRNVLKKFNNENNLSIRSLFKSYRSCLSTEEAPYITWNRHLYRNDNIDKIITEYSNKPFNLYTNNCQYFSKYFISNINKM